MEQIKIEVPFYGWSKEMLFEVEKKLSLDKHYHILLFPGDLKEIVTWFEKDLDEYMIKTFNGTCAKQKMRVRDKVQEAIKIRFKGPNVQTKAMLSQLNKFYFNLHNFTLAYKNFWRTVDQIWYLAGDKATDFNYYSKRGLLFSVYKAVFLYYVSTESEEKSWEFLEKRIENVMKIGDIKSLPAKTIDKIKDKIPFIRLRNKK